MRFIFGILLLAGLATFAFAEAPDDDTFTLTAGSSLAVSLGQSYAHLAIQVADIDSVVVTMYRTFQSISGVDLGYKRYPNPESTGADTCYYMTKYSISPWNIFYSVDVDSLYVTNRHSSTTARVIVREYD